MMATTVRSSGVPLSPSPSGTNSLASRNPPAVGRTRARAEREVVLGVGLFVCAAKGSRTTADRPFAACPGARAAGRASPRARSDRRRPPRPVPPARREDARLAAAGAPYVSGWPRSRGAARARGAPPGRSTALEVAVLDHGHPRVERAVDMIRLWIDRQLEVEGGSAAPEQGGNTAPLRQRTRRCGTAARSRQRRRRGRQGCRLWPPRAVRRRDQKSPRAWSPSVRHATARPRWDALGGQPAQGGRRGLGDLSPGALARQEASAGLVIEEV